MLAPCSFASERLVYRAADFPTDDAFLLATFRDPATQMGYFGGVTKPYAARHMENWKKHVDTNILSWVFVLFFSLLAAPRDVLTCGSSLHGAKRFRTLCSAVICLKADDGSAGEPIGVVDLEKREMGGPQNRCCGFGLVINKQYQVSHNPSDSSQSLRLTRDSVAGQRIRHGSDGMDRSKSFHRV
jgi:hypothetical protein